MKGQFLLLSSMNSGESHARSEATPRCLCPTQLAAPPLLRDCFGNNLRTPPPVLFKIFWLRMLNIF